MLKKTRELECKFHNTFGYQVNTPEDVIMEDEKANQEFCEVLTKCIETGIDETGEKYGTSPIKNWEWEKCIID